MNKTILGIGLVICLIGVGIIVVNELSKSSVKGVSTNISPTPTFSPTPTLTPTPTVKTLSTEIQPTRQEKQYGGWYWQPELDKTQIWLGIDSTGNDIWVDGFPTPTQTPQRTEDINPSDSLKEMKSADPNTLGTSSTGARGTIIYSQSCSKDGANPNIPKCP